MCRSREGAWIEMFAELAKDKNILRRSREGAWIEMFHHNFCPQLGQ